MSKGEQQVPANQIILTKKAIEFLQFAAAKDEKFLGKTTDPGYTRNKVYFDEIMNKLEKPVAGGHCAGACSVKARTLTISSHQQETKSPGPIHNNIWFKETRQLLAKWTAETDKNYTDDQRNSIFLFIEQIFLAQNFTTYLSESQIFDIDFILPVLTDKTKIPKFKSIGQIYGFYSAAELTRILNSTLRKDRFIFIGSHSHVGLLFINEENKIEFFDINHDQDDIIYENLDSVVNYFSTQFPRLNSDALLPLRLYAFTTNALDNDFPSVHEVARLCENGVIAYSPKISGYLGGISSLHLSNTEEYLTYFAKQISAKTDSLIMRMVVIARLGNEDLFCQLKDKVIDIDLNKTDHLAQNMLMHAIIAKKYLFVELLLKEKIKLDLQDIFGWTALMYASKRDNAKIFTQLLSAGCDPLIKDKSGKSAITHINETENSVMMSILVNHQFAGGKNILIKAVINKDLQSISELLTVVDVNHKDQRGRTALFYATAAGEEEIARTLLLAGADPSIQDQSHKTARHYAQEKNQTVIIALIDWWLATRKILESATDTDRSKLSSGEKTSLMIASKINDLSSIRLLLGSEVDIDKKDVEGRTALFYAAAGGHEAAVKLLLEGADLSIKDRSGKTARTYAEEKNHHSITSLIDSWLAGKTVQSNSPDESKSISGGKTLLMIASRENNIADIRKLLNAKVDVHAADKTGRTALFYAAAAGHKEIANLLLAAGANPLTKDNSDKIPSDYAQINKKYDMMFHMMEAELGAIMAKPVSSLPSPRGQNKHFSVFNDRSSQKNGSPEVFFTP